MLLGKAEEADVSGLVEVGIDATDALVNSISGISVVPAELAIVVVVWDVLVLWSAVIDGPGVEEETSFISVTAVVVSTFEVKEEEGAGVDEDVIREVCNNADDEEGSGVEDISFVWKS